MNLKIGRTPIGYRVRVLLSILLVLFINYTDQAIAETGKSNSSRIALVIGNANYPEMPLRNPVNDAHAMAKTLRGIGFEVIEKTDVSQKEMNRAITAFGEKLKSDSVALFYYAGHGMQVRGHNYLMPIDAQISGEGSVKTESVDVDAVLEQITGSGSSVNIVILDACRNNPFERRFRSGGGSGLAQMEAPKGTMIAYATSPGKTAADGNDNNGLYTSELLKAVSKSGMKVEDVFKTVRVHVAKATNDVQIPWESSSLTGDFYFRESPVAVSEATVTTTPVVAQVINLAAEELEVWKSAQQLDVVAGYEDYLEQYPTGHHVKMARAAIAKLNMAAIKPLPEPPPKSAQAPAIDPAMLELEVWKSAQQLDTVSGYEAYVEQYPTGRYAKMAKAAISKQDKATVKPLPEPPPKSSINETNNVVPEKIAMAAPNNKATTRDQKNVLTVGDSWSYNYRSNSKGNRGQLVFEIKQVDDKSIEEAIQLKQNKEPGFEDRRNLQRIISLEGFVTQNRYLHPEFAPYVSTYDNLNGEHGWPTIDKNMPTGTYLSDYDWLITAKIIGKESISVPAGKFDAIKVEVTGSRPTGPSHCQFSIGIFKYQIWYVPEVKRYVKSVYKTYSCELAGSSPLWDEEIYELTEYRLN